MCGVRVATRVLHVKLREGGPTVLAPETRCVGEREVRSIPVAFSIGGALVEWMKSCKGSEGQRKAQETKLKRKAPNCTPPYYTHQKGTRMPENVFNQRLRGHMIAKLVTLWRCLSRYSRKGGGCARRESTCNQCGANHLLWLAGDAFLMLQY
jgi:hypothetical protein